ncbi:MAG: hypothetical protein ACR2F5_04535 [Candidatus Limnocylindria bacterium]
MSTRTTRTRPKRWQLAILVMAIAGLTGFGAVRTNVLSAGDRLDRLIARVELVLDPPPDRPTLPTVVVTPRPTASPTASPTPAPTPRPVAAAPSQVATPVPVTPTPAPIRTAVKVEIVKDQAAVFTSQLTEKDCAVAATQMVLTILGLGNPSKEFQQEIKDRIDEWQTLDDSHNGGWGPAAVGEALVAYGAPGYEVRAYASHIDAMRDAAIALSRTGKPVVLFPWWGAHSWVMTGYEADADPTIFPDAQVTGLYILDPWFPRTSSIWGTSDPPGNLETLAEMERNWPYGTTNDGWSRPGGVYEQRDGMYVVLLPTTPIASGEAGSGS